MVQALFRRFDDVLHYRLPDSAEIRRLFEYKIEGYDVHFKIPEDVVKSAEGLSHAEISKVCDDAIKNSILYDVPTIGNTVIGLLNERHNVYSCGEF